MNYHLLNRYLYAPQSLHVIYVNNSHDTLRQIIPSFCTLKGRHGDISLFRITQLEMGGVAIQLPCSFFRGVP